jgi:uncharacterized protein YeaO (DUF488 family)
VRLTGIQPATPGVRYILVMHPAGNAEIFDVRTRPDLLRYLTSPVSVSRREVVAMLQDWTRGVKSDDAFAAWARDLAPVAEVDHWTIIDDDELSLNLFAITELEWENPCEVRALRETVVPGILGLLAKPKLTEQQMQAFYELDVDVDGCDELLWDNARFSIVDEDGHAIAGATVQFGTRTQSTDAFGNVEFRAMTVGDRYEVIVTMGPHYERVQTLATVGLVEPATRIVLSRATGRYVRVTNSGDAIPGATVVIEDADGTKLTWITDAEGMVHFHRLRLDGAATIKVSLEGFTTQRAQIAGEQKNGAIAIELPLTTTNCAMRVTVLP